MTKLEDEENLESLFTPRIPVPNSKVLIEEYVVMEIGIRTLAREYGRAQSTIGRWLRELEVPIRPRGRGRYKGRSFEEIFGEDRAREIREKMSKARKGKTMEEIYGVERAKKIKKKMSKPKSKYSREDD